MSGTQPRDGGTSRRLNSLLEVSKALAVQVDLDPLLEVILEKAAEVMDAERSTLFLYDPKANVLRNHVSGELARHAVVVPLGVGISGHVAQTLEPLNVHDAYADPRFNPSFDRDTGFRTRNILCAALLSHDGRLVGVIQLLNKRGNAAFSEDDEVLLRAFASIAGVAIDRTRLVAAALESKAIEEGLRLAHDIQMGMLTRRFPKGTFDMHAAIEPAKDVGGDFYDVLETDRYIWFTVGDVSGKGPGAALFMAITLTLFRASAAGLEDPSEVLGRMNRALSRDNDRMMFVTVFVGRLDRETGHVLYSNGGHNPPYILRAGGALECLETSLSPALGAFEEAAYTNAGFSLDKGDMAILYTDGVNEAQAKDGSFYGLERFEAVLRQLATSDAASAVTRVVSSVGVFAAGAPPADDLTVLALRVAKD